MTNQEGHETIVNEMDNIQNQITQLWGAVVSLRKDVDELKAIWHFGQRMSDDSGLTIKKREMKENGP
jgi:hypothetical protein